ncbi:S-adenosyl-L-methionine-dependent methyltransferase [Apiospora saccharicola]|uniref:S-adenosyl-L-methionine-dependent methyltransferase n=1 Tax=Apiospora saccharicola TaxID=335842 RepID=A0ABR1U8U6_9PEZI
MPMNAGHNRHLSYPYPAENVSGFDSSGMIYQQSYTMNGRPILPYPDPSSPPVPDSTILGGQYSQTPFDFATSQQLEWQQQQHAVESYYPSPPYMLPIDDEYSLAYPVDPLMQLDRNNSAGIQPDGNGMPFEPRGSNSISNYRPIAPAPALQMPHPTANVAAPAGPNWQQQQQQQPANGHGGQQRQQQQQQHPLLRQQKPVRVDISIFPNDVVYDEHGRTFQAYREDGYYLPNDPKEQDRLDFQHEVYKLLLKGRLHLAPIRDPRHVLDLGTGTGIWANEFAQAHPEAQVLGTDLALIQPTHRPLPPNVSFIQEDAEEDEWSVPMGFDFIHVRELYMSIKAYTKFLKNIYKHLAPGGWIEVQDVRVAFQSYDGSSAGSALERYAQLFGEGLTRLGRDITALDRYPTMLADIGFVEDTIREYIIPMPCSDWPEGPGNAHYRRAGQFQAINICQVVESVTCKVLRAAGVSKGENQRLAAEVQAQLVGGQVRGYWPFHVIYAQKPW